MLLNMPFSITDDVVHAFYKLWCDNRQAHFNIKLSKAGLSTQRTTFNEIKQIIGKG